MRIVIKVGTSTLAHSTGRLNIRHVEELVKVLSDLKNAGHEVILVSSGAIGMGVGKLSLPARPTDMSTKQACAAVGQCELMYTYDRLFTAYSHTVAQILLTGVDIEHTERRQNFQNTLSRLLELDALFLNQDRHLNNIALLHTDFGCKPCPIFDCGASFLLDFNLYRPDIETQAFLSKAQCLPFKSSFTRTDHTAQSLYGKQLEVDFARSDIEPLLDAYLDYYPKQFRYLLKERVLTVLLAQKKKLF